MLNETELRNKLSIDINALHIDAQEQPQLAEAAGELAAEARAVAKRQHAAFDETKADTERDVRANPEQYGLAKTTENSIAAAVTTAQAVREARSEVIEADKVADIAAAIRDGYQHRKTMLDLEGRLYAANYWGEVRGDGRAQDAGRQETEAAIRTRRRATKNGKTETT